MRRRVVAALLLLALAGSALAAGPALRPSSRGVVEGAIAGAIRPAFAGWADASVRLRGAVAEACAAPAEASLDGARAAFATAVLAWSGAEVFSLGPLERDNRIERIFFWPDRKGIGLKQVQALLAGADETATDPKALQGKSVAVQGYGALEFLLFGTGAESLMGAGGAFRCRFALGVAGAIAGEADAISKEWAAPDGIALRLTRPAPDDPDYRSIVEVHEALVGLLAHGTELVRDQRLLPFLGRDGEAPKPKSAPLWRSGLTLGAVRADLEALRALYLAAELDRFVPDEAAGIAEAVAAQYARLDAAYAKLGEVTLEAQLADPAARAALDEIVDVTRRLQVLFGEELPAALGLSVGFSSLDGD